MLELTLTNILVVVGLRFLLKDPVWVIGALVLWHLFGSKLEFFKHDGYPVLYDEAKQPRISDSQCKTVECALAQLDPNARWNYEYDFKQ